MFNRIDYNRSANLGIKFKRSIYKQKQNVRDSLKKILVMSPNIFKRRNKSKDYNIRLYNLGFRKRTISDLLKIAESGSLNNQVNYELAMWYANQRNENDARQCLKILEPLLEHEKTSQSIRETAIMISECYRLTGESNRAKEVLNQALTIEPHADLFLAYANLETVVFEKIVWINKALSINGLSSIDIDNYPKIFPLDRLKSKVTDKNKNHSMEYYPRVSVIIPAYNASKTIRTALNALKAQTWPNLEIIIVDDGSSDDTASIVNKYGLDNCRVNLIENEENWGPYVARNIALKIASGEFITCHDADDWSHPQMIEKQVMHLLNNPAIVGNTSEQVRATSELIFYRRDRYGRLITRNFPSFMFRRCEVTEVLGYWDSVRFSADHELIRRVKKVFGSDSIVNLNTGPLCFQREHSESLTSDPYFGSKGYYKGARKEYYEAQTFYHSNNSKLFYKYPQKVRPFPVPEPMWIKREYKPEGTRHFEKIIVSDFRIDGNLAIFNLASINACLKDSDRVGVVQMYRYDMDPKLVIHSKIRKLIDGERLQVLVYGEKITCDCLYVNHFPALQVWQEYLPEIITNNLHVMVDQIPVVSKGNNNSEAITTCAMNLIKYFGQTGIWYPGESSIREVLLNNKEKDSYSLNIAPGDWPLVKEISK